MVLYNKQTLHNFHSNLNNISESILLVYDSNIYTHKDKKESELKMNENKFWILNKTQTKKKKFELSQERIRKERERSNGILS